MGLGIGTASLFEILFAILWAVGVPAPTTIFVGLSEEIAILRNPNGLIDPPITKEELELSLANKSAFRSVTAAVVSVMITFTVVGVILCFVPPPMQQTTFSLNFVQGLFLVGVLMAIVFANIFCIIGKQKHDKAVDLSHALATRRRKRKDRA